jgi:hypothetical protein
MINEYDGMCLNLFDLTKSTKVEFELKPDLIKVIFQKQKKVTKSVLKEILLNFGQTNKSKSKL